MATKWVINKMVYLLWPASHAKLPSWSYPASANWSLHRIILNLQEPGPSPPVIQGHTLGTQQYERGPGISLINQKKKASVLAVSGTIHTIDIWSDAWKNKRKDSRDNKAKGSNGGRNWRCAMRQNWACPVLIYTSRRFVHRLDNVNEPVSETFRRLLHPFGCLHKLIEHVVLWMKAQHA